MAAHTYTHIELLNRAAALRQELANDHLAKSGCKRGSVFTHDRQHPFQIIVHDKGASLIVNTQCGKCRSIEVFTEAL